MRLSELKHKPQELPCCEGCPHKGKGVRYCVDCVDVLIHNDLI